jgi:hypothetical protein
VQAWYAQVRGLFCPLAIPPVRSRTYVWSPREMSSFARVLVQRSSERFEGLRVGPADKE